MARNLLPLRWFMDVSDSADTWFDRHGMRARTGRVLRNKWRLDHLLGFGAVGAVYAATHRNGLRAAIKVLHPTIATDPAARQRFQREGYIANSVPHPGAVRVLDDDEHEGLVFLVQELLEGTSLDHHAAQRGGRLPPAEVLALADQLLDIVAAAHEQGITHRDLKPANLFLTDTGALKLLDFGMARVHPSAVGVESWDPSVKVASGSCRLRGTPAFMAPEQAMGEAPTPAMDLWSVAATMWTLLTGELVHPDTHVNRMLLRLMTTPPRPLRQVAPGLPEAVARVVDRGLAFRPADRHPSARQMQAAVRIARARLTQDAAGASRPSMNSLTPPPHTLGSSAGSAPPPHRRASWSAVVALVAAAITTGLLAGRWSGNAVASSPPGRCTGSVAAP